MARAPDIPVTQLTPEQQRIYQEIASVRSGVVRGPFPLWLRIPEIADRANHFGNSLRLHGKLDKRLFELMVLVVARHWSAQYTWSVHQRTALEAGLSADVIDAIGTRRTPVFAREDERLVHGLITELNESHTLGQPSYDRAIAALGLDLLIELITGAGFYTTVVMMVSVFDTPVPSGERPLP